MNSFGARLRSLREQSKMTQEELSTKLQISKSAVGMYERDEREPDFDLLQRIAAYFDVSTDYLIKGADWPIKGVPPEQADFLKWVEDNLQSAFFYDFHKSPEEQKEELMETLKALWEVERRKQAKRENKDKE